MLPKTRSTTHCGDMFGEVFICQFPFTSGAASKIRPALVLFDLQQDAIICRVTSVQRNGPLDVVLADWHAAGLLKPSVARLDRIVTAEKVVFVRRLGNLSAPDLQSVRDTWNQQMRL
jgi:mRNA interferase MazF